MVFGAENKIDKQGYEQEFQEIKEQIRTKTAKFIEGKTEALEVDEFCERILDKTSKITCCLEDTLYLKTEKNLEKKCLYDDIESSIDKIRSELMVDISYGLNLVTEKFRLCDHLMTFSTLKENSASATETIKLFLSQEEKDLCEYMKSLKKRFSEFCKGLEEFGQLADKLSESISKENSITDN